MTLSADLDLELAWKKAKRNLERNQKVFVNNPHITNIIEGNKNEFFNILSKEIDNGYSPLESQIINFPKSDWTIRPASFLKITDVVIYSAIIIELYDDIKDEIEWSSQEQRFSRILLDDIDNPLWMVDSYKSWRLWKEKTRELLDEYNYIVISDIASYFESIEHRILNSHVKAIHENKEVCDLLQKCLRRWQRPKTRGLPQGYYPSNILSELYLNSIDRRLDSYGIRFARYSDDLNIYCDSKEEAIQSLKKLIELYREKGLVVQKEKTKILTSEEAIENFQDPNDKIEPIEEEIDGPGFKRDDNKKEDTDKKDRRGPAETSDTKDEDRIPYTDGGKDNRTEAEQTAILEAAFEKHILDVDDRDDSVFKYLIRELGDHNSKFAVDYCMNEIKDGKPEIRRILDDYFSKLDNKEEIAEELSDDILDDDIHYEFQKYAIVRWMFENQVTTDYLIQNMREMLEYFQEIPQMRNYIIAYLGEHGDKTDNDMISSMYGNSDNNVRKSIILMAIRDMERDLRSELYSHAEKDHYLCRFSVDLARSLADSKMKYSFEYSG